jgi:hypothetical protein
MTDAHARAPEPPAPQGGLPAAAEQRLPPAILALQRSAGNAAVSGMIARQPRPPHEEPFELGKDISLPLAQQAKRLAAKPIGDAELLQLHDTALENDESVSDDERLFMTALLEQQNRERLLKAKLRAGEKLSLVLPLDAATQTSLHHVADLRRPTATAGDPKKQILALAGDDARRAARAKALVAYADAHKLDLRDVLAAMIAAASDSTPGDQVSAGTAYAVAAAVKHPAAAHLRSGRVKVDERPVKGAAAAYSPVAHEVKGDTIDVPPLDINNLHDRGIIIHELEHVLQDAAAPATGLPKFVHRDELEVGAYKAEGLYNLRQIAALPAGDERKTAALQVARTWDELRRRGALLAAKADPSLAAVVREVNALAGNDKLAPAELKELLGADASADESVIKQAVSGWPSMSLDGLRGESRLDRKRFTDAEHDAERFKIGAELMPQLAQAAWERTRAGALDDAGLGALRAIALAKLQTIDDDERLFMAALLDPVNARRFHAENPAGFSGDGKEIWFLTSTITPERRKHVADFGRTSLPEVEQKPGEGADSALDRQMRLMAGDWVAMLNDMLVLADQAKIPHLNIQLAMMAGASDSTPSDRAFTAAVYIIAQRAGLSLAADVRGGRLKVDAVWPGYIPRDWKAMYSATPHTIKGDTLYVPTTLDPRTLAGQGTILHELSHAADDKARADPSAQDGELRAFRTEARHYLTELIKIADPAKRREEAQRIGADLGPPAVWALILEARAWPPDEHNDPFEIVHEINATDPSVPAAEVERALRSNSDDVNLRGARAAIDKTYKFEPGATTRRDGLRGDSSLD